MTPVPGARRRPDRRAEPGPAATVPAGGTGARAGLGTGALRLARRHVLLLVLVVLATVARVYVTAAYSTALWFPDSGTYVERATSLDPAVDRPFGYSAFLAVLDRLVVFRYVAVAQHVLGLAMVVLVYTLLQRRGVSRRVSLLAVVPLAFDAYLLNIEHFILAETLFMLLLTLAVVALLVVERPGALLVGTVGLLMGALTVTRTVGTFLVAVVLVYLVVRLLLRTLRWTAVAAFAVGVAAVLLPYASWFHAHHGSFALTDHTGHFLYGRVATFVQCEELDVPERLRPLCPAAPPEERPTGDNFVWMAHSPANAVQDGVRVWSEDDLAEFATIAITGQPGDYLYRIVSETAHYLRPGRESGPQDTCPLWWEFPVPTPEPPQTCSSVLAPGPFGHRPALVADLRAYQQVVYTPGPVLGLCLVAGFGALLLRRGSWRDRLDPALLAALGLTVLVGPAMTASFDYRFLLPTLAVLPPAAALALRGASPPWQRRSAEDTPGPPPPGPAPAAG
ncbi:phospholipid carrier-dependent glycosyltransferase [Geodermatophilus sp. DSM 44513]|uniref:phospholipid carrier-dependent glycosyltransferase n=1 Tax=Geodermatophilus sp. DSM 44513 TaxID=1528104 RepID=UPI001412C451|nr:phospholipid carrier-dependent glycosyltransferase [Geodermatophilus sp. DSM 44513]WNV77253.1 phospholipid carrier-dependent glycosyltransferase [Geodermatophilus sp. DSM 44513]